MKSVMNKQERRTAWLSLDIAYMGAMMLCQNMGRPQESRPVPSNFYLVISLTRQILYTELMLSAVIKSEILKELGEVYDLKGAQELTEKLRKITVAEKEDFERDFPGEKITR